MHQDDDERSIHKTRGPEVDILEKIKKARSKDKKVVRVVEEIKKTGVKVIIRDEWQIERELVLKEGKVYVPKDKKLRVEIIQLHYDISVYHKISHSLVVILELNSVSEVQYKEIMIIGDE